MTHIRYTPGLEPGGAKQIGGPRASVIVVVDDEEIDISLLVVGAQTNIVPGKTATLTLTIAGFEIA